MTWNSEVVRTVLAMTYFARYRYRDGHKLTMASMLADIEADDGIADSPFDSDRDQQPESPRRFCFGTVHKQTGIRAFTTPGEERLVRITRFVHRSGFLTSVATKDHTESIEAARKAAQQNGLLRHADPVMIHGGLWGTFLGTDFQKDAITHHILLMHHIYKEEFLRVRQISVVFDRKPGELDLDFVIRADTSVDWMNYEVRDGLAALDRKWGNIFNLRAEDSTMHNFSMRAFGWNQKGHRIMTFNALSDQGGPVIEFRLCQFPGEVKSAVSIMRSVSDAQTPACNGKAA